MKVEKSILDKAGALIITLFFIISAFIPVATSQQDEMIQNEKQTNTIQTSFIFVILKDLVI